MVIVHWDIGLFIPHHADMGKSWLPWTSRDPVPSTGTCSISSLFFSERNPIHRCDLTPCALPTFFYLSNRSSTVLHFLDFQRYQTSYVVLLSTRIICFLACGLPKKLQTKLHQVIAKAWLFDLSLVTFPVISDAVMDTQTRLALQAPSHCLFSRKFCFYYKYSSPWLLLFRSSESSLEQPLSGVPPIPLPWGCLYSWSNYRSFPSSLWHPGVAAQGLPQASHCVGSVLLPGNPHSICCGWFSQPLEWIILLLPACQRNQLESWARERCWERPAQSGSKSPLSKINQGMHQLDNPGAVL